MYNPANAVAMLNSMNVLYSLLNQSHLPEAMGWDRNKISSQIQAYQRVLDLSKKKVKELGIKITYFQLPNKFDYREGFYKSRTGYLLVQLYFVFLRSG